VGRSTVVVASAIDIPASGAAVVTLRLVFAFDPSIVAMILQDADLASFQPDSRRDIPTCAFCGLDLRDAFDLVDMTLSPPSNSEIHYRKAHAACINDAFGRGAKVDFFIGTGVSHDEELEMPPLPNTRSDEHKNVLGRIIEREKLDFVDSTKVEIVLIELDRRNAAVAVIEADYLVDDAELDDILERA
jgi:hypothetical protein